MNLSSCVADSVVLSFDSAGQTLGAGTNLPPSVLSALSTWPHLKWSLVRWGRAVSGKGSGISQDCGKVLRSFSGDLWSKKWDVASRRLCQLLKEFALDAPSSFRSIQVHRTGICFLSTDCGLEGGAEGIKRPGALGMLEQIIIRPLQQNLRLRRVSRLPADIHCCTFARTSRVPQYTPPPGCALYCVLVPTHVHVIMLPLFPVSKCGTHRWTYKSPLTPNHSRSVELGSEQKETSF